MKRIPLGTDIVNQVGSTAYRIESFLGAGGFGAAYGAYRLDSRGRETDEMVCLKLTTDAKAWHGEAFFAGLLGEQSGVVRQIDAFPTTMAIGLSQRMVFVIETEYVESGTVRDACMDGRLPWEEARVARKIRGLLKPLALLHGTGTSHRDITPGNVYVANRAVLKLGDFGIAKTGLSKQGVRVDYLTPAFAPKDLGAFWRPADDVYQVGLLMMTLLRGKEVFNDVKKPDVNSLTSREFGLREAIKAAISVKSQRPQTASDLAQLLP